MVVKEIIQIGNPILVQKQKPVKDLNAPETKKIIQNLIDTMRANNLIGIAAAQI